MIPQIGKVHKSNAGKFANQTATQTSQDDRHQKIMNFQNGAGSFAGNSHGKTGGPASIGSYTAAHHSRFRTPTPATSVTLPHMNNYNDKLNMIRNNNGPGNSALSLNHIQRMNRFLNTHSYNNGPMQTHSRGPIHNNSMNNQHMSQQNNTGAMQSMNPNLMNDPSFYSNPYAFLGLNSCNDYGQKVKSIRQFFDRYDDYTELNLLWSPVKDVMNLSSDYFNALLNQLAYFHDHRHERAFFSLIYYPIYSYKVGRLAYDYVILPVIIPYDCFKLVPQLRSVIALIAHAIVNNYIYGDEFRYSSNGGFFLMKNEDLVLMNLFEGNMDTSTRWDWSEGGHNPEINMAWLTAPINETDDNQPLRLALVMKEDAREDDMKYDEERERYFLDAYTTWFQKKFQAGRIDNHFVYLLDDAPQQNAQTHNFSTQFPSNWLDQLPRNTRNAMAAQGSFPMMNANPMVNNASMMRNNLQNKQVIPSLSSATQGYDSRLGSDGVMNQVPQTIGGGFVGRRRRNLRQRH